MRRQRWDGPAILVTLFLCSASSAVAAAEPPPEVIAKGKALTEAGDCGSCHTADPAKRNFIPGDTLAFCGCVVEKCCNETT